MAMAEPVTTSHQGTVGGKLRARRIPVITALPSEIDTFLPIILWAPASVAMLATTDKRIMAKAWNPNR